MPGHGDMCAVCYSPLDREGRCEPDVDDAKRELFTTECAHVFHRCCLVRCREADFSTCPMCRAALPSGLTPEHVREKRAAQRLADQANARRDAVIGAAARAREAVRAQYVRRMINRPVGAGPAVPNTISEEDDEDAPAAGEMPPWMSPPRNRAGSAPATPARVGSETSLPVMRGGGGSNSNVATPASAARPPAEGGFGFVTAAEELRARHRASAVAVAAAYATASAPSTPARGRMGADGGAEVPTSVGTVSSLVRDAARGAGNAATLDGWDAAEADRDRRARAAEAELGAVALALGGLGGDDWGEDETTRGNDDQESESAVGSASATGSATANATFAPPSSTFAAPFRSAKAELAAAGAAAACATRALVANGTASAPATPMHHRPAVAAAMTAAEEAAAAGDEDARRRADAVVRRLLADEDP